MINLVEGPFGREVLDMELDRFYERFQGYVNKDLFELILKNEEEVEVTYSPNEQKYRFDFVDMKKLIKEETIRLMGLSEEYGEYSVNLDINLKDEYMKVYVHLNTLESMLRDLYQEEERKELILKYKGLVSDLKNEDFCLEVDEITGVSLVSKNLKSLTIDKLAMAMNMVEDFRKPLPL